MDCKHLIDNINLICEIDKESTVTQNHSHNLDCSECGVNNQNWMCLKCGVVNCGRYVNQHAKQHAEIFDHQLCISCDIYSVYCYKCDDYISCDTEDRTIDKVRKCIMNIRNHRQETNDSTDIDKNKNDSNNIVEEPSDSVSNGPSEKTLLPPCDINEDNATAEIKKSSSHCDIPSTYSYISSETNVEKPSKSTKSDEPVRGLKARSLKRSYSGDSSSASESVTTQTNKNKEKKLSPYNGKSQKEKKVVGLKNLGNTCFMNAVLQSLSNIQEFSYYFSQLPSLELKTNGRKIYHSRSYTRQEVQEVVMAEELRKVLINLNTGSSKGAISPECLFLVIWKVVPRFRGYQQQDAHEFLRYMLDRLHTELLQLLPTRDDRPEYGFILRAPSASIVTAVFGGTLQSEVRCLACGTESKKLDPFLDLSLELPDCARHDTPVALADCLASFVQVEELADTERYFCSSCKCKQKSTKQFRIRRLPNVLCLHLKRFRWHNYFRTKVDTNISFPLQALDMSQFVLSNVPDTRRSGLGNNLYDLAAVIVHHGSGAGSGHYTAFAINEGQWFHFNDQTVRATEATVVASCKPYILFYIRRELNLRLAS